MNVTLILYIVGLCGLIRFPIGNVQGMDVFLVNAQFNKALNLPAHMPRLTIGHGQVENRNPTIDQFAVTVDCATAPKVRVGLTFAKLNQGLPWRSMDWVADLPTSSKDVPRTGLMQGGDGRVSAGLKLVDGTLEAAPPTEPGNESVVWKLGGKEQVFTNRIKYTLQCPGDTVVFHLYSFKDGNRTDIPVKGVDGMIIATMSNLPDEAHRTVPAAPGLKNTHLRAVYQLLGVEPSDPELPRVTRIAYPDDGANPKPSNADPVPHGSGNATPERPDLCFPGEILGRLGWVHPCSPIDPYQCGQRVRLSTHLNNPPK